MPLSPGGASSGQLLLYGLVSSSQVCLGRLPQHSTTHAHQLCAARPRRAGLVQGLPQVFQGKLAVAQVRLDAARFVPCALHADGCYDPFAHQLRDECSSPTVRPHARYVLVTAGAILLQLLEEQRRQFLTLVPHGIVV